MHVCSSGGRLTKKLKPEKSSVALLATNFGYKEYWASFYFGYIEGNFGAFVQVFLYECRY